MDELAAFAPDQTSEFLAFFHRYHYGVIRDAMPAEDIRFLNAFMDRSQHEIPDEWRNANRAIMAHGQILTLHPQLDRFVQPAATYPLVEAIMGPHMRFAEYQLRDVPRGGRLADIPFHRDAEYFPPAGSRPREGVFANCCYVCVIHYLTDVDENTPSFCVVPDSHRREFETVDQARQKMGEAYREVPIFGPAGTAVFYNINLYHTRLGGNVSGRRRTQHCYYGCATSPLLNDWAMVPRRLIEHPDPAQRTFYSQWSEATKAYARSGYALEYFKAHVKEKPT